MGQTNPCSGLLGINFLQELLIILISWYQLILLTCKLKASVHFYQQTALQKVFNAMNRSAQAVVSLHAVLSIKGRKKRLLRKCVMQLHLNPPRRKPWCLQYFIFLKQSLKISALGILLHVSAFHLLLNR